MYMSMSYVPDYVVGILSGFVLLAMRLEFFFVVEYERCKHTNWDGTGLCNENYR